MCTSTYSADSRMTVIMSVSGESLCTSTGKALIQEGQLSVSDESMCTSTGTALIQEGQLSVCDESMCTSTG